MKLTVTPREKVGKKVKNIRKQGLVPGVIYGKHLDSAITISMDKVQLVKVYRQAGGSTPVELSGEGIDQLVLFQDVHLNPITDHVMHVDFLAVNKDEKVTTDVPVELIGVSPVEKENIGYVQLLKTTVEVEALPLDLPHDIKVDISALTEVGQVIFVKDLNLGDKVTIVDDLEQPIANVNEYAEEESETDNTADSLEGPAEDKKPEAGEDASDE